MKTDDGPIVLLWFTPYISPFAKEIGPFPVFQKSNNYLFMGDINPTTPLADITLKRIWARAAKMRYEETSFAKLGGDTDISDKVFTKGD